ncbi:MAG: tetratricopeptide repeat protein [Aromatoleum sp.]|nr:tetratricopeptide repeat protein [Aromatoleum sp.]
MSRLESTATRFRAALSHRLKPLRRWLSAFLVVPDAAPGTASAPPARTALRPGAIVSIALSAAMTILVLFLAAAFLREVLHVRIWIDPIEVAQELTGAGMTSTVAAERVADRLDRMHRRVERADTASGRLPSDGADVTPVTGGVSLRGLARWVRELAGRSDLRFGGEITHVGDGWELTLRERSRGTIATARVEMAPDATERLLQTAAEDMLTVISPDEILMVVGDETAATRKVEKLRRLVSILSRQPAIESVPSYYSARALLAHYEGKPGEALARLDEAITRFPNDPYFEFGAAFRTLEQGDRDATLRHAERAAELGRDKAWVLRYVAVVYSRLGMPDRAIEHHLAARRLRPDWAWLDVDAANFLLDWHRPAEAAQTLERGRAGDETLAAYLETLGTAYARSANGPGARRIADELKQRFPATSSYAVVEGEIALASKQYAVAAERFADGQRVQQGDDASYPERIGAAYLGLHRNQESLERYLDCLKRSALLAPCHLGVGVTRRELDDPEDSLVSLATAAAIDPADPQIARETAKTLRALGRRGEARVADQRADELELKLKVPLRFE